MAGIGSEGNGSEQVTAQALVALVLSIAGGGAIAFTGDWQIAAGLLLGGAFVAIGMLRPALFVLVLLATRPLLDGLPGKPGELVALVLLGVCALVMTQRKELVAPRATKAFCALLVVSSLACLLSLLELRAAIGLAPVEEIVRLGALFAVYLLASQVVRTPSALRTIFVVVGLSGVVPALSALAELLDDPQEIASLGLVRVSGTFVNPVALSSYLALCVLVLMALPREALPSWIRWAALAIIVTALVTSYGREGWAFVLLVVILLHWRSRRRVIAAVAVACIALLLLLPGVRDRALPSAEKTGTSSTFASYDWRLGNWRGLLGRYAEKPLTGWGLEATSYVNLRRPVGAERIVGGGFQAHNAMVRALVEGGPLLLAVVVALFLTMIASMRRVARDRDSPLRAYARTLAAIWVGLLVLAVLTSDLIDATALMYGALALTGAVEGAHHTTRGRRAGRDEPASARSRSSRSPGSLDAVS